MPPTHTLLDLLKDHWAIGLIAFGVSLVATPIMRLVATRTRVVDRPDALLKPHSRPIAYLGGVAMCVGLLAGLLVYLATMEGLTNDWAKLSGAYWRGDLYLLLHNPIWNLLSIALASMVITFVGMMDDIREMRPRQKVLGQVAAAGILLAGGVGTKMAYVVLTPLGLVLPVWLTVVISSIMCLVAVVLACNATNLLDGLDGLCGGVTGIIAIGFLILAAWLGEWKYHSSLSHLRVALCYAMAGAVLGFLPYNIPPAKIFMGDAGSMLLGFFVATMMALFCDEVSPRWLLAACGVFALPIIDTGLAVVRRMLARKSIFAGDRSHLYDQLIDRGLTVRQVVGLFYALSAVAATVAVLLAVYVRLRYTVPIYIILTGSITVMLHLLGMVRPEPRKPSAAGIAPGSKTLRILFTSAGRRVALLNEFHRAARDMDLLLEIHAADVDPMAPALQVADHAVIVPQATSGDFISSLTYYCRSHKINAIVPLIDTELLLLSQAREHLAREAGAKLIISSPDVVRIASDKVLADEFLRKHGFKTPHIYSPKERDQIALPAFTKPRYGSSSHEVFKIRTAVELDFFRKARPGSIIQEFIEGEEYTVDVFADFDGKVLCAVPRRRHEVRGGEVTKGQTVRSPAVIERCSQLVEALGGCVGMITVQCFLTDQNEVIFIEINPRFGGGVPLSIHAGADSPRWLIKMLLGRDPVVDPAAWTDGLLMLRYAEAIFSTPDALPRAEGL